MYMNDYEKQANDFAKKYGVKLTIIDRDYKKHFVDDKDCRWVFKCRLTRNGKSYTFNFGQSISDGDKEPTMYDILACLQKYECGTFSDFCGEFGYDCDSRKAERIYKAVCREYDAVKRLFGDILVELQEIQ